METPGFDDRTHLHPSFDGWLIYQSLGLWILLTWGEYSESLELDMVCICIFMKMPNLESLTNLDKKTNYNSNITMRQLWGKEVEIPTKN